MRISATYKRSLATALAIAAICWAGVGCGGGAASTTIVAPASGGDQAVQPSATVTPPSPQPQYAHKTYTVGDLEGTLKAPLYALMEPDPVPYDAQATDAPLLVAGGTLAAGLASADSTGLVAAFTNHQPIILMQPTAEEVNALLGLLGQPQNYTLPAGLPTGKAYAELFAVEMEASGNVYTWESYPPENTSDLNPSLTWSDNSEAQLARAGVFLKWLGEEPQRAATQLSTSGTNLRDISTAYSKTYNYSLWDANYQITYIIYACHSVNVADGLDYDWFYVEQKCLFNPSGAWKGKHSYYPTALDLQDAIWFYAGNYSLDSWFPGQDNQAGAARVTLIQTAPKSTNNVTEVTSEITYNFGGTVSFDGGPRVSGDAHIKNSEKFTVSDCEVTNDSISRVTNALWSYDFKRAAFYWAGPFYMALNLPPRLTYSSFEPVNQWIWKVSPALREDPSGRGGSFVTRFSTSLIFSQGEKFRNNLPYAGEGPLEKVIPQEWTYAVPLVYPPLIAAKPSLVFPAAAGSQTLDIAVGRNWTVTSNQPWCTVSPTSGPGNHALTIVTVDPNGTGGQRQATLTLSTADGKGTTTVTVYQTKY